MRINVFPDYCSTGLWNAESHGNISPEAVGITDPALLLALKYWHWTWEFLLVNGLLSTSASQTWLQDGEVLVAQFNEKYAGQHEFVYKADLGEVPSSG